MTDLQKAVNGETVIIPFRKLYINESGTGFVSLDDFQAWCTLYDLQYEKITLQSGETAYQISKA